MTQPQHSMPSPDGIFDTLGAYQRSAGLKAAIQIDLFTPIAEGANTAAAIAQRLGVAERGVRILSDYMTIMGLLTKTGDRYALAPDAAAFLTKKSPAYIGGAIDFIVSPHLFQNFDRLGDTIRRGGVAADANTVAGEEQEIWVDFARAMAPMMAMPARAIADILQV